jgi:hypothetical protein
MKTQPGFNQLGRRMPVRRVFLRIRAARDPDRHENQGNENNQPMHIAYFSRFSA